MLAEVIRDVEQCPYQEARSLEVRHFHAWLERCTDAVRYRMPGRSKRYPEEMPLYRARIALCGSRQDVPQHATVTP